jgi:hypothetical protein
LWGVEGGEENKDEKRNKETRERKRAREEKKCGSLSGSRTN